MQVDFENELKMDAVFGYQNDAPPEMESVTWTRADGTVMSGYQVPKMDFTLAEKILAVIKDWNDKNPESAIKIRAMCLYGIPRRRSGFSTKTEQG